MCGGSRKSLQGSAEAAKPSSFAPLGSADEAKPLRRSKIAWDADAFVFSGADAFAVSDAFDAAFAASFFSDIRTHA